MAAFTCTLPDRLLAYARAATLLAAVASLLLAFLSAWAGETETREPGRHTLTLDDGRGRGYLVYSPEPGKRGPGDVLFINGTADPINPFEGGDIVLPPELGGYGLGRVLSSRETARLLAERAGHRGGFSTEAGEEADGNPATAVAWTRWKAENLPEIALVTINGGGHTIPQPGTAYPALLGPHSADIDAPLEAWAFVERNAGTEES